MRRGLILAVTFAIAFAAGRYLPPSVPRSEAPAPVALANDKITASSVKNASETPPAGSRPSALAPRPNPRQTPWIAHVARDPEHHAQDAQRIQQAVFGQADAITDLDACRVHFEPIETQLRLRTTITISRTAIDIGPAESVDVVDGIEISDDARTCVLSAFRRATKAQPAFPDDVHPYRGPYDLEISVIGETADEIPSGDAHEEVPR